MSNKWFNVRSTQPPVWHKVLGSNMRTKECWIVEFDGMNWIDQWGEETQLVQLWRELPKVPSQIKGESIDDSEIS